MGTERNLIPAINGLSRQAKSVDEAIELFESLLAGEVGGATLLVDPVDAAISPGAGKTVAAFMESRQFPFRGLYTAPLTLGSRKVGNLVACFGSFGAPGKSLPEVTAHIARQLSEILGRTSPSILPTPGTVALSHPEAVL
jgi:hypothetical protein